MTDFSKVRKNYLEENINRQYSLLNEWEKKRDIAENPNEKTKCESEIDRAKQYIQNYIDEYIELCKKEGASPPREFVSLLNELKEGQKKIIGSQEETLAAVEEAQSAILNSLSDTYQNLMQSLISVLDEKELRIVQMIMNTIELEKFPESEVNELLPTIQKAYVESNIESRENLSKTKKLADMWNSPDITARGKLKLSVPLIPTILRYSF